MRNNGNGRRIVELSVTICVATLGRAANLFPGDESLLSLGSFARSTSLHVEGLIN